HFFLHVLRPPPRPPLFPYTTLFRSRSSAAGAGCPRRPTAGRPAAERAGAAARLPAAPPRRGRTPAAAAGRATARRAIHRCGSRRSEEHTSELQSRENLVCRLLLEKK